MDEATQRRFLIESLMRGGLERNEFEMHFQPQIDLEIGQFYSAEALMRWKNPELGFVPPDAFISIAEETGFIVPRLKPVQRTVGGGPCNLLGSGKAQKNGGCCMSDILQPPSIEFKNEPLKSGLSTS